MKRTTLSTNFLLLCLNLLIANYNVTAVPSSQDIGLCGLAAGLNWTTIRGFAIPYRGWTCTSLGYATSPCTWTGVLCRYESLLNLQSTDQCDLCFVSGGSAVTLNLHYLGLTGTISSLIGAITTLKAVRIDINSLTGTIAPDIGNLTNLQYLGISTNRFNGSLPSQIANLRSSLKYLLTYNNFLTGSIPTTFCSLTNLQKFYPCDSTGSGCAPNSCIPNCINYLTTASNYGQLPYCTQRKSAAPPTPLLSMLTALVL